MKNSLLAMTQFVTRLQTQFASLQVEDCEKLMAPLIQMTEINTALPAWAWQLQRESTLQANKLNSTALHLTQLLSTSELEPMPVQVHSRTMFSSRNFTNLL